MILILVTLALVPSLMLVQVEARGRAQWTGAQTHAQRVFFYLPGGRRLLIRERYVEPTITPFAHDFQVSEGDIIVEMVKEQTLCPWYFRTPTDERTGLGWTYSDRQLGWYGHLYNRDAGFRAHIQSCIADGRIDPSWFSLDVCSPDRYVCGFLGVNLRDPQMQAVMAYSPVPVRQP